MAIRLLLVSSCPSSLLNYSPAVACPRSRKHRAARRKRLPSTQTAFLEIRNLEIKRNRALNTEQQQAMKPVTEQAAPLPCQRDAFTCIKNVDVDLPQSLIVFSGAVPAEGIHLVADGHGRVVHPARPAFQVHGPP